MKASATCAVTVLISTLSFAAALTLDSPPTDPDKIVLPAVPKVLDADSSGFPELPTVSSLQDDSSAMLSSISAGAAKLQQQMSGAQAKNAARLQRQKTVFDAKLKEQEENNVVIVQENARLAKKILSLKAQNGAQLKESKALQKENAVRQQQLKLLKEQVSTSQAFLANTMKVVDDSKSAELEVLSEQTDQAKSEDKQAPSFLSIDLTSSREDPVEADDTPESLVKMLRAGIADMHSQGEKSQNGLKKTFFEHFQAGTKRHKALLAQQDVLKITIKTMTDYSSRLELAVNHLKMTRGTLVKSLHDASLFLNRLSQLSGSKPQDGLDKLSELKSKEDASAAVGAA